MVIKNAKILKENGGFENGSIYIEGDCFANFAAGEQLDASGCFAAPGLVDIHFHGCMGHDFCDADALSLKTIAAYQAKCGVAAICPAVMTLPEQQLIKICKNAAAFKSDEGAALVGINLEGPFISAEKSGAQNVKYIRLPDVELFRKLQTASNGLIKIVGVAPEKQGAQQFISALKDEVKISLAHTKADYACAKAAFKNGASHVTHLFNAMPPFLHREPGVIGAASDSESVSVELIADGVHLHPSTVRTAFKLFGKDRVILISDSIRATGLPNGEYELGGQKVFANDNRCTLADGTLAGSNTNLADCVKSAVKMGVPLEVALKCASENPSKAIGAFDRFGSITAGKSADLIVLNEQLETVHVVIRGKLIF